MSEEEIIDRVMMIDQWKVVGDIYTQDELNAIGELLDLYEKEKQKNNTIEAQKLRDMCYKIDGNYISKDKIREKIEKYNKMINATYSDMTVYGDSRRDVCIEIKNNLQEILEEE